MKQRLLAGLLISSTLAAPLTHAETVIGGYGELHYNNLDNGTTKKQEMDFHRFVLFIGHDFNDQVRLHSEFELEHALVKDTATGDTPGEIELEQAYIEIDMSDSSSLKAGVFLIPVGILNETHEPPTFYGVERNPVEKNIIPTTWWEGGAMYSVRLDNGISYDLALHSGLSRIDGNIRSGRQKVAEAEAESLAYTARIKYSGIPGLELAATVNRQDDLSQGTATVAGDAEAATLIEAHAIYSTGRFKFIALYADWNIDFLGGSNLRDSQQGSVIEAAYKVTDQLGIFVRQNNWNTQTGIDEAQSDIGFNYWPHENVVFKFDYQAQNNDAGNNDGFNLGVGYSF
ncbi:MAG: OprO/OprP family phosphate-selective porin [Gammaproteobacteria bacterium]|nr:OprO/OprP family phosphate-selective porin [Gammaproteobacteria bacterium]